MRVTRRLWTKQELEYLADHYGALPNDVLARRLNRTEAAIKVAVTRKFRGLRRTGAFYTARMLTLILGRKNPRTVALWIKHGWLKATKGPPGAGRSKMWNITENDIVALLKQQPWLADIKRMEEHYFRSIIRDEWNRDPWYSSKQVAPRLGMKSQQAVWRYIRKGWLRAEKQLSGMEHRGWVIRESTIQEFLKNDPRKHYKSEICRAARTVANLRSGIPIKLSIIWQVQCPSCGDRVTVTAPPWMLGREVKEIFVASYTNEHCTHGSRCSIPTDCSNTIDFRRLALAASRAGASEA
jgi:hypothetical protein